MSGEYRPKKISVEWEWVEHIPWWLWAGGVFGLLAGLSHCGH